jgi:soluble lytic murein transglycosylase-like protein
MNVRTVALNTAMAAWLGAGLLTFTTAAAFAQTKPARGDKPASNLEIIHEKLKADKKLIVSQYMELTESEAKKFWPVYDEYQKELQKSNERLLRLLQSYAADYKSKSLTDEKAKKLLDEWIAFEQDEAKRRRDYAPKVLQALPAKKAARYLQIENEYRILLRYDLAATVPLVE